MLPMIAIYVVLSILFLIAGAGIWILRGNGLRDLFGKPPQEEDRPKT